MELKVSKRNPGKVKKLLLEKQVPGIIYSKHIKEPIMIQFNKNSFFKLYKEAGSSSVITLKGDGIEKMALIHKLQLDSVKDFLIHVDFLAVKKGEKVKAEVPVIVVGEENLQKAGLKVNLISNYIEVEAIPSKLPHNIKVDVNNMKNGDNVHVKDLNLGKDVIIINDENDVILVIYNPEEEAMKQDKKEASKQEEIEKIQEENKIEEEKKENK